MDKETKNDLLAHDLICNFFMLALNSFRFDSVLLPYPPTYADATTHIKYIDKLRNVASQIPSVVDIFKHQNFPSEAAKELFNWITCTPFKLVYHDRSKFNSIKKLTRQELDTSAPNHIFEVIHSKESERKFSALKHGFETIYAYHGSRTENFHSILHHGLASHLNKNSLFGYGTYFSSELNVSLLYTSSCIGWDKSFLGSRFSCVAVCEIVDHPTVKSHLNDTSIKAHEDKLGGKIPKKYYLVENNDLVKIRYLLLYVVSKSGSIKWWQKYRFALMMTSYFVLLLIVGLSNCTTVKRAISQLLS